MRGSSTWASLLAVVFLLPAVALAQLPSPAGSVYGTAVDLQGSPVPGVTVTLSGASASDTSRSDAEGDFHFPSLSPGTYTLTLERADFATARRSVTVPLGTRVSIVVTLSVAGATESVVVSGDASTARPAQTGVAFERPELAGIPSTRDPWAFLRQAPGVLLSNVNVGGGQSAQQPDFVGKGTAPDQNLYILDGVGVSVGGITPLYFDFDSLDSIRVTTGGAAGPS